MSRKKPNITKFLVWAAKMAGNPLTFILALLFLVLWLAVGIFLGFTSLWLLILDTIATVIAAIMVIIIQNTQIRETRALHLKIDELIRVTEQAEDELIAIEQMEEEEFNQIKKKLLQKRKKKI